MAELFEDSRYILVPHILSDVARVTGFLNCFQHLNVKHKRKRPGDNVFLTALIGYGCNIGVGKIGQIAKGIGSHSLYHTINWYFSVENVLKANDR